MNEEKYIVDDRPRDYTKYINMSKSERAAEIARLEQEIKEKKKLKAMKKV